MDNSSPLTESQGKRLDGPIFTWYIYFPFLHLAASFKLHPLTARLGHHRVSSICSAFCESSDGQQSQLPEYPCSLSSCHVRPTTNLLNININYSHRTGQKVETESSNIAKEKNKLSPLSLRLTSNTTFFLLPLSGVSSASSQFLTFLSNLLTCELKVCYEVMVR